MVVRLHWRAERQLKAIFDYYNGVAGSRVARNIVLRIIKSIDALRYMPFMAPVEPLLADEPVEYRSLVILRRYKAIYHVDEETGTVVVVDFWDCRMDPVALKERVVETIEE
jgi:plasmid stabilization system protein ParE